MADPPHLPARTPYSLSRAQKAGVLERSDQAASRVARWLVAAFQKSEPQ
jgi:hypothetical protein